MEIEIDPIALLEGRNPVMAIRSERGSSDHTKWHCEDGYIVGYSTGKIHHSAGGKHDGKYACIVWKPNSKKNPTRWQIVYFRTFAKRKTAKTYAEKYFWKHNPKRAKKHGIA